MNIAIGSDRNGLDYKSRLTKHLEAAGYTVNDVGTYEYVPCDSPVFAAKVARLVASGECKYGILICATGTGMVMAANKVKGILCGMGYDDDVTRFMRQHNDANVIAFGQKHMDYADVERRTDIFLTAEFVGMHHAPRVQQIRDLEEGKEITQTPILNPDWVADDKKEGRTPIC